MGRTKEVERPVRITADIPPAIYQGLLRMVGFEGTTLRNVAIKAFRQSLEPNVEICIPPRHLGIIGQLLRQAQQDVLVLGSTMAQMITQEPDFLEIVTGKEGLNVQLFLEPQGTSPGAIAEINRIIETKRLGSVAVYSLKNKLPYGAIMVDYYSQAEAAIIQLNLDQQRPYPFFLVLRGEKATTPFLRQYQAFLPGSSTKIPLPVV